MKIYDKHIQPLYAINSWLLLCSLYSRVCLNLMAPFLNSSWISNFSYGLAVFLFLIALIVNRFRVSKSFVCYVLVVIMYALTNSIVVSYKSYVLTELVGIISSSFLPMYLITLQGIDYEYMVKSWKKLASTLTLLFPIFVTFYVRRIISYADIGHYSHLNILPIGFSLLVKRKDKFWDFVLFSINGALGLVLGSRTLVVTSLILLILMVIVFTENKDLKYYFRLSISAICLIVVFLHLSEILGLLFSFITKLGLNSRNLYLFMKQLEGAGFEAISSGRSWIYETMLQFIKDRSGWPAGLGAARYATSGLYYYSHNVFLDFSLVFGILGAMVFFLWYTHRTIKLAVQPGLKSYEFIFFFLISVSFWLQSFMGAYFVTHRFFYISFAILITKPKRAKLTRIRV